MSGEKLEFDGVFRGKIFENGGEINKSRAESEMGISLWLLLAGFLSKEKVLGALCFKGSVKILTRVLKAAFIVLKSMCGFL